jgi:hypothetical protein
MNIDAARSLALFGARLLPKYCTSIFGVHKKAVSKN